MLSNVQLSTKVIYWQDTGESVEQEFYITRLDWFEDSTQSVLNVCINFDTWKKIENCNALGKTVLREKHCSFLEHTVLNVLFIYQTCYKHFKLIESSPQINLV